MSGVYPPFSKPVDPIVGQLVDAWRHVRPPQPDLRDRKTGEHRQFLFCVRGQLIGRAYLNDTLIPALCAKAGIPETDSRGALTSHRARSTIATQLLNAPEPLSIADLQEWLGHKHIASTRHYAAILQRRLTAAYHKADYFARNVRTTQVLIDRETILSGAASGGEQPWKYYDLGDGYCTYASSPNAHTASPAPAARSTCPNNPAPDNYWQSKTASTRCSNNSCSPTTNAPPWKATATYSLSWLHDSARCRHRQAPYLSNSAPTTPSSR
ncbi:tyrosine-type recombinase/integrase [Nocardia wallacei]|uniref:tyrosine-type recombinase/integrase n=1 Tax=Nocardia wallacei TaxID=480035 RepID=UPI0024537913|nr:tyrosine-type recombinase/integrase [Nocardia wallacei]